MLNDKGKLNDKGEKLRRRMFSMKRYFGNVQFEKLGKTLKLINSFKSLNLLIVISSLCLFLLASPLSFGQNPGFAEQSSGLTVDITKELISINKKVQKWEEYVRSHKMMGDRSAQELQNSFTTTDKRLFKLANRAKARLGHAMILLKALGSAPKKDEVQDTDLIAKDRKRLNGAVEKSTSEVKKSALLRASIGEIYKEIKTKNPIYRQDLLLRYPTPWTLRAFNQLKSDIGESTKRFKQDFEDIKDVSQWWGYLVFLGVFFLLYKTVYRLFRRWVLKKFMPKPADTTDSPLKRGSQAFFKMITDIVIPIVIFLFLSNVLFDFEDDGVLGAIFLALYIFVSVNMTMIGVFRIISNAPDFADNLWKIDGKVMQKIYWWLRSASILVGLVVATAILEKGNVLGRPFQHYGGMILAFSLSWVIYKITHFLGETIHALPTRDEFEVQESQATGLEWLVRTLVVFVKIACVVTPIIVIFGYGNLGLFIVANIVSSVFLINVFSIIQQFLVAFFSGKISFSEDDVEKVDGHRATGYIPGRKEMKKGPDEPISVVIIELSLTLGLFYVLALIWGFFSNGMGQGVNLSSTLSFGSFHLSFSAILTGILIFVVTIIGVKVLNWFLKTRIISRTNWDAGLKSAVQTGFSYLGGGIAILIGLNAIGLDFSKIAIVAGALSVGIGFGLQTIVNNFISGIILLFERPVKVGDWVFVSGQDGIVKKISVRATEIETFERATLTIPNSVLISNTVTNWTRRNNMGRLDISIGVAYGSDVEKVKKILTDIAHNHGSVRPYPSPHVLFRGFGDSSLDFQLRCFLRNITERLFVQSDILFQCNKAFSENDIEVPFPQRDLHIRSGLEGFVKQKDEVQTYSAPLTEGKESAPEDVKEDLEFPALPENEKEGEKEGEFPPQDKDEKG